MSSSGLCRQQAWPIQGREGGEGSEGRGAGAFAEGRQQYKQCRSSMHNSCRGGVQGDQQAVLLYLFCGFGEACGVVEVVGCACHWQECACWDELLVHRGDV